MTDATDRAKALLAAAEQEDAEDYPRPRVLAQIERLAPATLAVAITLAEALKRLVDGCEDHRCSHQDSGRPPSTGEAYTALDEVERLFPETQPTNEEE